MRCIVTGVSGFIGAQLFKELAKSHEVIGTFRNEGKVSEVQSENVKLVKCDLSDYNAAIELFRGGNIDCIFHVAALAENVKDYMPYYENNIKATINLLECCRIFNVNKFIFSSSWAVYGIVPGWKEAEYLPVDEEHPIDPFDFYSISKYHNEVDCKFYNRRYNLNVAVLRYSRVYGKGRSRGALYTLIKGAINNEPLSVNGDISMDLVSVDDVVLANIRAAEKVKGFEIFNIGSGKEMTLLDICSRIVELTNSHSKIESKSQKHTRFVYDVTKSRKMLGLEPKGIDSIIADYVKHLSSA